MLQLDLTGLMCPLPVLKTKKLLMTIDSGVKITILTTDPASIDDLKDFCDKTNNILIEQKQENHIITTIIERR